MTIQKQVLDAGQKKDLLGKILICQILDPKKKICKNDQVFVDL